MERRLAPLMAIAVITASCATTPPSRPAQVVSIHRLTDGEYHHKVLLTIRGRPTQELRGIMKLRGQAVTIVGLGPFDASVFRLEDQSPDTPLHLDLYVDEFRRHKSRILAAYREIKPLLIGPFLGSEATILGQTCAIYVDNEIAPGKPKRMRVESKHFQLMVEVVTDDVKTNF